MDLHRGLPDGHWSIASGDGLSGRGVVGGSW